MKKIAVFASGFGSNFEVIAAATESGQIKAEIALLVTDHADCYAVERAHNHHVDVFAFNPKSYPSKAAFETEIVEQLRQRGVELIVLAGYMRLIGEVLLNAYPNKIINIHPALLPAFPGKHAIEQAYNYGVKVFGITIHYVDAGMDTGKIIAQACFTAKGDETLDEIETQIHALEHKLYPQVIQRLCMGE